jgi:hypothetical protein
MRELQHQWWRRSQTFPKSLTSLTVDTTLSIRFSISSCLCLRPAVLMSVLLLLMLSIFLAGCGGQPDVQPFTYNEPPWMAGEVSLYQISEKGDEIVGTVRVDMISGGRYVELEDWTIRREIVTPGDTEIAAVEATSSGLRPKAATLIRTRAEGNEMVFAQYDQGQVDMQLTTVDNNTTPQRVNIPSDARDQRTILQLARMLPLDEDYATRFNSYLPVADQQDRVTLQVVGRDEVEVPAGTFDAWRVELEGDSRQTEAWISVDAPFPLIKYREGRNGPLFELLEYTPGQVY